MFSGTLAPPSVSIFSSTASEPLQLWSFKTDSTNPGSCVRLLHDSTSKSPHATTSLVSPPPLVELGGVERNSESDHEDLGYALDQTVLHIQSPKLPTTYILCPPDGSPALGLKHPWMHIQVRNIGRPWSFEVGLVDSVGRTGVLRLSTFQVDPPSAHRSWHKLAHVRLCHGSSNIFPGLSCESVLLHVFPWRLEAHILSAQTRPTLKLDRNQPHTYPLLHLPLSFPSRSSRPLTAWTKIDLHLPIFIPYFSSSSLLASDGQGLHDNTSSHLRSATIVAVPSAPYSHVSFVRVYANCRLRRIWFDENGPGQVVPWEFELYSSD